MIFLNENAILSFLFHGITMVWNFIDFSDAENSCCVLQPRKICGDAC